LQASIAYFRTDEQRDAPQPVVTRGARRAVEAHGATPVPGKSIRRPAVNGHDRGAVAMKGGTGFAINLASGADPHDAEFVHY